MMDPELERKNKRIVLSVFALVFLMVGASFASVPLYDLFCRVTGYGGTTQVAASLPDEILDREMRIRFNADTSRSLPWRFRPEMNQVTLKIGQEGLISYTAQNRAPVPTAGTAVYNVTPSKAGRYFHKIQCFCFDRQVLQPGQEVYMPVTFFVDPAIADDPDMDDVRVITLSYTFFPADSSELDEAMDAYYNEPALQPDTPSGS